MNQSIAQLRATLETKAERTIGMLEGIEWVLDNLKAIETRPSVTPDEDPEPAADPSPVGIPCKPVAKTGHGSGRRKPGEIQRVMRYVLTLPTDFTKDQVRMAMPRHKGISKIISNGLDRMRKRGYIQPLKRGHWRKTSTWLAELEGWKRVRSAQVPQNIGHTTADTTEIGSGMRDTVEHPRV